MEMPNTNTNKKSVEYRKPVKNSKQDGYIIFKELLKNEVISESKLSSKVFFSFIIIGLLIQMIFSNIDSPDSSYGPASASIWGYGIIVLSILGILFMNLALGTEATSSFSMMRFDVVILLVFMLWLISINISNYEQLNRGDAPTNYYIYSNFTNILIFVQVMITLFSLSVSGKSDEGGIARKMKLINILLSALVFVLIMIQQIILDNFSVDVL